MSPLFARGLYPCGEGTGSPPGCRHAGTRVPSMSAHDRLFRSFHPLERLEQDHPSEPTCVRQIGARSGGQGRLAPPKAGRPLFRIGGGALTAASTPIALPAGQAHGRAQRLCFLCPLPADASFDSDVQRRKCHQETSTAGRQDKSNSAMRGSSCCLHIMILSPPGSGDINPFSASSFTASEIAGESLFPKSKIFGPLLHSGSNHFSCNLKAGR